MQVPFFLHDDGTEHLERVGGKPFGGRREHFEALSGGDGLVGEVGVLGTRQQFAEDVIAVVEGAENFFIIALWCMTVEMGETDIKQLEFCFDQAFFFVGLFQSHIFDFGRSAGGQTRLVDAFVDVHYRIGQAVLPIDDSRHFRLGGGDVNGLRHGFARKRLDEGWRRRRFEARQICGRRDATHLAMAARTAAFQLNSGFR